MSYTYDELGREVSRGLAGFVSTITYDALGRFSAQASPFGSFTYTFDGVTPRPLTLTYPNSQATHYTYSPNSGEHRLQEIKHLAPNGTVLSKHNYTYDAESLVKTWTQQAGTNPVKVYEFGYDLSDQLVRATLKTTDPTPAILKQYGFAFDLAGNRTAEQVDDSVFSGNYNGRNQIESRQAGGSLLFRGAVNEPATVTVQNRPGQVGPDNRFEGAAQATAGTNTVAVTATDPSGNTRTNTYQVSVSGAGTSYGYDLNGNLTGDGARTFEYDAENRLTRVLNGAAEVARYSYDGFDRRVRKVSGGVTTTYVYDGADLVEERRSIGGTSRYVRGPGSDQHWAVEDGAGGVSYYLTDHLDSVVQVTNTAGQVTNTREYDPYGKLLVGAGQSGYAFTGREWDAEAGLYYYRARYYDPGIGRFMSEDPVGLASGVNLYEYVLNNPTNWIDPTGQGAVAPSPKPSPSPTPKPDPCKSPQGCWRALPPSPKPPPPTIGTPPCIPDMEMQKWCFMAGGNVPRFNNTMPNRQGQPDDPDQPFPQWIKQVPRPKGMKSKRPSADRGGAAAGVMIDMMNWANDCSDICKPETKP